ncbi:hypothetical protein V6N12_062246 [Hibiscus sabdariffa]|uniref:Uncharacterized protein n=1 Tax=Hibiscus sabdariffa TaxID=183260 RepID=A0ABR2F8A0_9ROSI
MVKEKKATTNVEEKEVISKDEKIFFSNGLEGFVAYICKTRLMVKMVRYERRRGSCSSHRKIIRYSSQDKVKPKSRHCEGEQAKFPHHGARPVEIKFAWGKFKHPKSMEVK